MSNYDFDLLTNVKYYYTFKPFAKFKLIQTSIKLH